MTLVNCIDIFKERKLKSILIENGKYVNIIKKMTIHFPQLNYPNEQK